MAARKASTKKAAPASTPQRKTRNSANLDKYFTTPTKEDEGATTRANTSAKRSSTAANTPASTRSSKRVKIEDEENKENVDVKNEDSAADDGDLSDAPSGDGEDDFDVAKDDTESKPTPKAKSGWTIKALASPNAKAGDSSSAVKKAADLQSRKLQSYSKTSHKSPFPHFPHPTAEEAKLAHRILSKLHGERVRPEKVVASKTSAGCGDSPSVLDALVRTILSQNTSDKNSTRAKLSMDEIYGGSDEWEAIVAGGEEKLQHAIRGGGLSQVKSRVIMSILRQAKDKYGKYSLDHLFDKSNDDAMAEMLAFQGVGPKTASCVLLFCLQRDSFAVDTHVHRIAGLLGWRPAKASRDETHAHLDVRIPDEDKYGLHILMVTHGKLCDECKAGGKSVSKCELRLAFRQGKLKGEAGEEVKEEVEQEVKEEGGDVDAVKDEKVKKEVDQDSGLEDFVNGMQGTTKKAAKDENGDEKQAQKKGVKAKK